MVNRLGLVLKFNVVGLLFRIPCYFSIPSHVLCALSLSPAPCTLHPAPCTLQLLICNIFYSHFIIPFIKIENSAVPFDFTPLKIVWFTSQMFLFGI